MARLQLARRTLRLALAVAVLVAGYGSAVLAQRINGSGVRLDGTAPAIVSTLQLLNGTTLADVSAGVLNLTSTAAGTGFGRLNFGTAISTNPSLKRNSNTQIAVRQADDSGDASLAAATYNASAGYSMQGNLVFSTTPPTISSGFGSTPSIVSGNGTSSFRVNVGTGGVATTGVVSMPAATTGWNCQVTDITTNDATRETSSTTNTVTVAAAIAWTSADVLIMSCTGF